MADKDTYSLCAWGSHPDEGNDDCHTGDYYDTLEDVRAVLQTKLKDSEPCVDTPFFELVGPDIHEIHANPSFDAEAARLDDERFERACRREMAMEAGMLHGVGAYNDFMGF